MKMECESQYNGLEWKCYKLLGYEKGEIESTIWKREVLKLIEEYEMR